MIISNNPPFIFVAINKTGTSSMESVLTKYFDEKNARHKISTTAYVQSKKRLANRVTTESWNSIPFLKHIPAVWIKEHIHVLQPGCSWDQFYKFCFVRHPLSRLSSIYRFHTQKLHQQYPEALKAGSFANWLRLGGTGSAKVSMRSYIIDESGHNLVDFVGRYESLHSDWSKILHQIGLPYSNLPHVEQTKTAKITENERFDVDTIDAFLENKQWLADLEHFGYEI